MFSNRTHSIYQLKEFRRTLFKQRTSFEVQFERKLREAKVKFEVQAIVAPYILDFVVPSRFLVIELDGPCHANRQKYDFARDLYLRSLGFRVIRLPNEESLAWVTDVIKTYPKKSGWHNLQKNVNQSWQGKLTPEFADAS